MKTFYFVADYTAKYYFQDIDNVLISVGSGWLDGKWHKWGLKGKNLFVDSGGFSFFSKWGEYPFTVQTYVDRIFELGENNNLVLCATRDYPCEPTVNREVYATNKERIHATVLGAIACIEEDPDLPWIPVLQGYTYDEYKYCFDLYEQSGITTLDFDYWAIGSVCARKGDYLGVRKLLVDLKSLLGTRLHTFGLSLRYLQDPQINNAVYSSDSSAWSWGSLNHHKKLAAVQRYKKKVDLLSVEGQTELNDQIKRLKGEEKG